MFEENNIKSTSDNMIIEILELILSRNRKYKDKLNTLIDKYKAQGSDCAYLASRLADNLFFHAIDSFEDEQGIRCMKIEAMNLGVFLDAIFSDLNRHGTREKYSCDDEVLNYKPNILINHHYESGGAHDIQKVFESLYL